MSFVYGFFLEWVGAKARTGFSAVALGTIGLGGAALLTVTGGVLATAGTMWVFVSSYLF